MNTRLCFTLVAAWLAFAAPAWSACPEAGGIGGTGARAEGGIGGTGGRAEGGSGGTGTRAQGGTGGTGSMAGDGIGGTGAVAAEEVGVVGVIAGFGSICVNGVEVHYDSATPVTVNGQPGSTQALALGQTVAVRAVGAGSEARARAISVLDAAVGPVAGADNAVSTLRVAGQRVQLTPSTVFAPGLSPDGVRGASPGEALRVSGPRRADGTIVATRVERAAPGAALVYGSLELDASGALRVGGMRIEASDSAMRALAAASGPVLVTGRIGGEALVAEQIVADPLAASLAPGRFVAQAYVDELQAGRRLRAGGLQYSLDVDAIPGLGPEQLVRLSGRTDREGRRFVERVQFLAEPMNPRPLAVAPPVARSARAQQGDSRGGSGGAARDGSSGRSDNSGRGGSRFHGPEIGGGGPGSGRTDRPDERPDRPVRADRPERPDRPDRSGAGGGPDRVERPVTSGGGGPGPSGGGGPGPH